MAKNYGGYGLPTEEEQRQRLATRKFIAESCELAKTLTPKKKILFLMRFDSGFSCQEIAQVCKCHEETVRRRLKQIADELNEKRNCLCE